MVQHENTMVEISTSNTPEKQQKKNPQLKKGNKVFLSTKNLKSKRPSKKLHKKKVRLFSVGFWESG